MAHLPFYGNTSSTSNNNNNNNSNNSNTNHSLLVNTMVGPANNTNYPPSSSSMPTTATNGIGTANLGDFTTAQRDMHKPTSSDLQKIITAYFERKGYSPANLASLRDASGNTISMEQLAQYIKANHSNDNGSNRLSTISSNPVLQHLLDNDGSQDDLYGDPDAYAASYHQLREWISKALDLYKSDLSTLLYPIFVHIYLDLVSKDLQEQANFFLQHYRSDHINGNRDHGHEIDQLDRINTPQQVSESALSQKYRNNKYHITMFAIPYELFINYIHEFKRMNLARIVDQHLSIEVTHEKSAGGTNGMHNGIGIMSDEADVSTDRLKKENDLMDIDGSRSGGGGSDTLKQIKKEATVDSPVLADISTPPTQSADVQAELEVLKDLRKRVSLGTASSPSVCAYTFHNTHDNLNCISISDDSSLLAGGFSESFIKIWSLKGDRLRKPTAENDKDHPDYVRLIGHAGPVYGTSFNHDNEYLLSCSQDQTARLWNMHTFENVVVYKSHNYPVWDVDFGPFGFYFATASHDRTARLWTCDHTYPLRIFAGHLSDVDVVKFHPNSKYLVTGSSDRTARLWDVQRGSCVRVFTGHTGGIKTVAISPNGRLMASAGEDSTVNLWDLGSGRRLKTLAGHQDHVYALDFSADSHVLVSGGADNTVRVWDVNSGTQSSSTSSSSPPIMRSNETKRIRLDEAARKEKGDKKMEDRPMATNHPLAVFPTKQTPIYTVKFTKRNLCLVAGAFSP